MTNSFRDKVVMVIDYGNFLPVAQRLARDFGKVLYYIPWETAFPKYNSYVIGTGIANVQRVYSIYDHINEVDIFVFCDLFFGPMQEWLRSLGKRVFGAGRGEDMEIYRDRMKFLQTDLGLPINEYEVLHGLDSLRNYLKYNDNKFVKTNIMRGHFESFRHENYLLSKPLLDELEHSLGIYKEDQVFIVEAPIEAICEIGYDGFVIDGKYPNKTLVGLEIKDCGYCGVVTDYYKLPVQLKKITGALSDTFRSYNYRGSYTNEVRIGVDRKGYLIDQTCRQPEPPTSLQLEIFDNYSEIVWEVAGGNVPVIRNKYKYGVQVIIKSEWAKTEPQAIYFPEQYRDFIKIKNLAILDGVYYYIPQAVQMAEIGGVIGMGDTLNEAIEQATKIAKEVKGYRLCCNIQSLQECKGLVDGLKRAGLGLF